MQLCARPCSSVRRPTAGRAGDAARPGAAEPRTGRPEHARRPTPPGRLSGPGGETYEEAGVNIAAGEEAVERIKAKVRSTFRPEVIGDIGGFGGLFGFDTARYRQPVLVSSTDGVGTKALVAQAAGRFDTIGVDLVAMCVDDLVCQGAEPLFFLDYIAVGRLDPGPHRAAGRRRGRGVPPGGCALIGGEMAEHPGAMEPGEFDLVGFAVGVAERDELIAGERRAPATCSSACRRRACAPTATRWPGGSCSSGPGSALDDPALPGRTTRWPTSCSAVGHLRAGDPAALPGRSTCAPWPTSPAAASPAT